MFADTYSTNGGNAAAAYRASHPRCANQRSAEVLGSRMLRKVEVREALERRRKHSDKAAIATRTQRQALWTAMMNDETQPAMVRLRASELLGKSQADFVEVRVAPINTDPQASEEELVAGAMKLLQSVRQRLDAEVAQ